MMGPDISMVRHLAARLPLASVQVYFKPHMPDASLFRVSVCWARSTGVFELLQSTQRPCSSRQSQVPPQLPLYNSWLTAWLLMSPSHRSSHVLTVCDCKSAH